jgi:uncharacterized membrane protein YgdD (TMEM256/DUF423 family)
MNQRINWMAVAGVFGALAVAIGAFGAHGLPGQLEKLQYDPAEIAARLATFETGARYQVYSALGLLALGAAAQRGPRRTWDAAGVLLLVGSVVFSGLLYVLAFIGQDYRWLGAIVPIGGVMIIAGWVLIAVGALRQSKSTD